MRFIKFVWFAVVSVCALVVVTVAWAPLFWLRSDDTPPGELVIDPDIDSADPGRDVDGEDA